MQRQVRRQVNLCNLCELQPGPQLPNLSTKHVNIVHINLRSVKNKIDILYEIMVCDSLDVVLISESWLKDRETDRVWLQSYLLTEFWNVFSVQRPGQKQGGRLLHIVKKFIKAKIDYN